LVEIEVDFQSFREPWSERLRAVPRLQCDQPLELVSGAPGLPGRRSRLRPRAPPTPVSHPPIKWKPHVTVSKPCGAGDHKTNAISPPASAPLPDQIIRRTQFPRLWTGRQGRNRFDEDLMKPTPPFFPFRGQTLLILLAAGLNLSRPTAIAAAPVQPSGEAPAVIRLEAETGRRTGSVVVASNGAGGSGAGYVTGFLGDADRVTLTFTARAGFYDLAIRYRAPVKGFLFEVNGLACSGKFADSQGAFTEQRFGKVELREGENTLAIHGGWTHYEIDRVDLTPVAALPALHKPASTLCDPHSTQAARALMAYLADQYGEHTLSGTIEGPDVDYVREVTGQSPAIIASDMLDITTAPIRYDGVVPGQTEQMIERARQGHILSYCWHWRSPSGLLDKTIVHPDGSKEKARWYMGFYTRATTFDLEAALAHPEGTDYALLMTDIDMVAGELRKLASRGIPVLWRPLHEAEGGWFWWGAKGPKPFVQFWRLLYDRLTRVDGLHNLIWVYTGTANPDWYPGDDVVDIIGIDEYPADVRDPLSATWDNIQARFSGRKLVALSEFGGAPDLVNARRLGVTWSYFASWNKDLGPLKMDRPALKRIYNDPRVINLGDLPKDRWSPTAEEAAQ
jgi:mannan endo-1,4-beta-mannosidase